MTGPAFMGIPEGNYLGFAVLVALGIFAAIIIVRAAAFMHDRARKQEEPVTVKTPEQAKLEAVDRFYRELDST